MTGDLALYTYTGGEAEGGGFRDDLGGTLGRLENPLGIPRDRADGLGTA